MAKEAVSPSPTVLVADKAAHAIRLVAPVLLAWSKIPKCEMVPQVPPAAVGKVIAMRLATSPFGSPAAAAQVSDAPLPVVFWIDLRE